MTNKLVIVMCPTSGSITPSEHYRGRTDIAAAQVARRRPPAPALALAAQSLTSITSYHRALHNSLYILLQCITIRKRHYHIISFDF